MIVRVDFSAENDRRYGRPWIARVSKWPVGGKAELDWGTFLGTVSEGGVCEIEAQAGDVIRYGQKDNRGNHSVSKWAIVEADGSYTDTTEAKAAAQFRQPKTAPAPEPLVPSLLDDDEAFHEMAMQLKRAHDDGERYALDLRPGVVFEGAGPAAVSRGYTRGTPEYRMFIGAALDVLEDQHIRTDDQHVIVYIGGRPE
jgi:hypothetical protein